MKKNIRLLFAILIFSIGGLQQKLFAFNSNPPRLVVLLVVDQLLYNDLNKLSPHFKFGLKYLLDNGVLFTNARQRNGQPGTAVGHAGLSTGTDAENHGFIGNEWMGPDGELIACDKDTSEGAAVLSPTGVYDYGKSSHMLMVDGITDQCVLQSTPKSPFCSYSISLKSRSAIATASVLGHPLWLDQQTGNFTSSKAYFDVLPAWVQQFNLEKNLAGSQNITWHLMYPKSPSAYSFFDTTKHQYARTKLTMINNVLPVPDNANPKKPYHCFMRTPHANKLILDLSQACISNHVSKKNKNRLLLWVCLSPLDLLGHKYGPDSIESIDMMYHLDKQLQKFIRFVLKSVGKHNVLLALTADHGVMSIPEILHEKGLPTAQRINIKEFLSTINTAIKDKHDIANCVLDYTNQELNLNHEELGKVNTEKYDAILEDIKSHVLKHPGIKDAWTFNELTSLCTQPDTLLDNIKRQLFRGRSGQIIIQPYPYALFTNSAHGTSHQTPYNYDTHVPLLIFHPGKFERRYVRQRVMALQLANTLAEVLNVPKPSTSTCEILPELFDPEYQ